MSARPYTAAELLGDPNPLAAHYARFRVGERVLLTGHSHQAWPDVAREGVLEAWDDAARDVDDKWAAAFAKAERVRAGFAALLGARPGEVALGQNTHELVTRFLSALPLAERPRVITTDGEFHTLRRQLDRLAETGHVALAKVAAEPARTLAERLAAAVDERTAAVCVSSVLFTSAAIVPHLDRLLAACRARGAELLVDAYHQLGVVPCDLAADGLDDAFVVGGGYKYCQLGEGNCFLRVPPGREHYRPVLTGWFSEFARLTQRTAGEVPYGEGAARWAGSTWDPTAHYRAARVLEFFASHGLVPAMLREVNRAQVARLAHGFDALALDPAVVARDRDVAPETRGGFLALTSPRAGELCAALRARGVWTDHRGGVLRLGPAPYVGVAQLDAALAALGDAARSL